MYQVIARKYRPQSFTELISQEHVKQTLDNAINQRRIAHGYIFSGQRGTGKTTVARIMARCLNCVEGPTSTPCGVCASCREITAGGAVDVIEIDAASNRDINEMRELRESVRYRPARDRYKVFIVDEAHQITTEAFNALLKTLEEPPEWVVFILCTTESHKIPVTIASRCQQFSFRSVNFEELLRRMEWICAEEGITAEPEALTVIAQAGEGSVRDSLSALDQAIACCGTTLRGTEVRALLGMFSLEAMDQISTALLEGDSGRMLDIVGDLESRGANLQHFCREISRHFRNLMVARISGAETRLIAASPREKENFAATAAKFSEEDLTRYLQITLDVFRDLQYSLQPRLHLELGLLKLVHAGRLTTIEEALGKLGSGGPAPASAPPSASKPPVSRPTPSGARFDAPAAAAPAKAAPVKQEPAKTESPLDELASLPPWQPAPRAAAAAAPASAPAAPAPAPAPAASNSDEDLLASLGLNRSGNAYTDRPAAKSAPVAAPAPVAPAAAPPAPGDADLRSRVYAGALDAGLKFTADAIEAAEVSEANGVLDIVAPEETQFTLKEQDVVKVLQAIGLGTLRVRIRFSAHVAAAPPPAAKAAAADEAFARALAHPIVQRFQETFAGSEVRSVRNLKE